MDAAARYAATLGIGAALGILVQQLLTARRSHRLCAAVPEAQLLPTEFEDPASDDRLLRRIETVVQRRTARIIVVLERLQDGHNYAAVLRTCESLGIQHVWIVSPPKRDDLFETAARRGREWRRRGGEWSPEGLAGVLDRTRRMMRACACEPADRCLGVLSCT